MGHVFMFPANALPLIKILHSDAQALHEGDEKFAERSFSQARVPMRTAAIPAVRRPPEKAGIV